MGIILKKIPDNETEISEMFALDSKDALYVAALVVAALCHYEKSAEETEKMLDVLKGPEPLTQYEKQFLHDRLTDKGYIPRSYFVGATPQNNYVGSELQEVNIANVADNEDGWKTVYVVSGGADSPRPIKLRQKKSTGQWFLNEQMLLADIRKPVVDDAWA